MKKLVTFLMACCMVGSLVNVNWVLHASEDDESSVEILEEDVAVTEGDSKTIENDSEEITVEEESILVTEEENNEEIQEDLEEVEETEVIEEIKEELENTTETIVEEVVETAEEEVKEEVEVEDTTALEVEEETTEQVIEEEVEEVENTTATIVEEETSEVEIEEDEEEIIIEEIVEEEEVVKSEKKSVTVKAPDLSVKGFVQRLYSICLSRSGEASGINYWTNLLTSYQMDAADVSEGFFYSKEFLNKKLSNEDFLRVAYKTFFDREADADGLRYWKSILDGGVSRKFVLKGFIESDEFTALCDKYKITRGYLIVERGMLENNISLVRFVGRLYNLCLDRAADTNGSKYWVNSLQTLEETASSVVQGFFYSKEYKNKKVSNEEFVKTAYRTMLDREPDENGLRYWLVALNGGASYDYILNGFVNSNEFKKICRDYGVNLGSIKISETRDKEIGKTRFIGYTYYVVNNKVPDVSTINSLIKELKAASELPSTKIWNMLNKNVYGNAKLSVSDKVRRTVLAITAKEPSANFLNTWTKKVNDGISYGNLVEALTTSNDYISRCKEAGVDDTPYYATIKKVTEKTKKIDGKNVKVLLDEKGNIIKNSLKANGYYYQIDSNTGEIIHKQQLMNDKIYMEGIDVSYAQGDIDLTPFEDGFVMIRAGYGWSIKQEDPCFKKNVEKCVELKIPFGVYWYSYATTEEESKKEAEVFAKVIEPYRDDISLGVWLDQEEVAYREKKGNKITKKYIHSLTEAFMNVISKKGYHAGVYASWDWLRAGYVDNEKYDLWVAHWGKDDGKPIDLVALDAKYGTNIFASTVIHQYYTSDDKLDKNIMYRDPAILKY